MAFNPVVEVNNGKLMGKKSLDYDGQDYFSFQGIPYAKPPVGELRLKPPEPHESWEGIRSACGHGNESLGYHLLYNTKRGSEDCLYLNVYTPRLPCCARCRLPVMFYIHGGRFTAGSGNDDVFGPEFLMTEMIVLVTINYRLGLLGFLALKDPELGVANLGLKDMVLALKWVQDNIDRFNGDRNNVTIFGCSAGALAVHCLILSPAAKGLFHKAIIESGTAFAPWAMSRDISEEACKQSGFKGNLSDSNAMLNHLQNLSEEEILDLQKDIPDLILPCAQRAYGPVVEDETDDAFLIEPPMHTIATRAYNKVPLIIGYNDNEGCYLTAMLQTLNLTFPIDFELLIPHYYNIEKETEISQAVAEMIKAYYYGKSEVTEKNIGPLTVLGTDIMFWRGTYLLIKNMMAPDMPIYLYRFSVDDVLNINKKMMKSKSAGACHADEVTYLFKCLETPPLEKGGIAENTMYRMVKLWTTFARTGNPNPKGDPLITVKWDPIRPGCLYNLEIAEDLKFIPNTDCDRMEFWDRISEFIAQNKEIDSTLLRKLRPPEPSGDGEGGEDEKSEV